MRSRSGRCSLIARFEEIDELPLRERVELLDESIAVRDLVAAAEKLRYGLDLPHPLFVRRQAIESVVVESVYGEVEDMRLATLLGELSEQTGAAHGFVVSVRGEYEHALQVLSDGSMDALVCSSSRA